MKDSSQLMGRTIAVCSNAKLRTKSSSLYLLQVRSIMRVFSLQISTDITWNRNLSSCRKKKRILSCVLQMLQSWLSLQLESLTRLLSCYGAMAMKAIRPGILDRISISHELWEMVFKSLLMSLTQQTSWKDFKELQTNDLRMLHLAQMHWTTCTNLRCNY